MQLSASQARPLDTIRVSEAVGTVLVWDGEGREYARLKSDGQVEFQVSGTLGTHHVVLTTGTGRIRERAAIRVNCETSVESSDETWSRLFGMLKWNLFKGREAKIVPFEGRPHRLFSDWLRDHCYIMRGKKYFDASVRDAVELFGRTQAEDGMVYDFIMPKTPQSTGPLRRFRNPGHVRRSDDPGYFLQRVPVEADVEYLYVDTLHQAWKAIGDTAWMTRWLDSAVRAMDYCRASDIRWSAKYQLIKRGFTIDTWDFQDSENVRIGGGDTMDVDPAATRFGVFHGDNTGYAASCESLAEMLTAAGRGAEAAGWRETAGDIRSRLDAVAWNGGFFKHHVPETDLPDLGVDHASQVSLSNALALNRGIPHEQALAILHTYQRLRREKPASSVGEYYAIYPPFERGFAMLKWHYMNGAVFPFVGGEISRGAFEHGEEQYGAQILRELHDTMAARDGQLPYYWTGCIEPPPVRTFQVLDITGAANADFAGATVDGVVGWARDRPGNDMAAIPPGEHAFHGVPVRIVDPAANGRRACIVLSTDRGDRTQATVPLGRTAASLYVHHASGRGGGHVGWVTLNYADGTTHRIDVTTGAQVQNWWDPVDVPYTRVDGWVCRVAWRGSNACSDIGTVLWGVNNPNPAKVINSLTFTHAGTRPKWFVIGVTASDAPKYFEAADACYGWLENWNASLILAALIEGLAGIQNRGLAFDSIRVAPRWTAAGANTARVTAKLEASGAYVAYTFGRIDHGIFVRLASSGCARRFEILLPPECGPVQECQVNGAPVAFKEHAVESSRYVAFEAEQLGVTDAVVAFR